MRSFSLRYVGHLAVSDDLGKKEGIYIDSVLM